MLLAQNETDREQLANLLHIPKESMDKIALIRADAQATLFKGADLDVLRAVDCGEYAPGKALKREMITLSLRAD